MTDKKREYIFIFNETIFGDKPVIRKLANKKRKGSKHGSDHGSMISGPMMDQVHGSIAPSLMDKLRQGFESLAYFGPIQTLFLRNLKSLSFRI